MDPRVAKQILGKGPGKAFPKPCLGIKNCPGVTAPLPLGEKPKSTWSTGAKVVFSVCCLKICRASLNPGMLLKLPESWDAAEDAGMLLKILGCRMQQQHSLGVHCANSQPSP